MKETVMDTIIPALFSHFGFTANRVAAIAAALVQQ